MKRAISTHDGYHHVLLANDGQLFLKRNDGKLVYLWGDGVAFHPDSGCGSSVLTGAVDLGSIKDTVLDSGRLPEVVPPPAAGQRWMLRSPAKNYRMIQTLAGLRLVSEFDGAMFGGGATSSPFGLTGVGAFEYLGMAEAPLG